MKKFYLTTPLYYVNDVPHIGHAYTTIAADVLARWKRGLGQDVFFLTGTDEHGQKIQDAADKNKEKTNDYVNRIAGEFKRLWEVLNITHNDFIQTTEDRHKKVVQAVFEKLKASGDIYKGFYEDWYCVRSETYYSDSELKEGKCPDCGDKLEKLKEESYFFKLSKYEKPLLDYFSQNPILLSPKSRANEILNFVKSGLKDLSVSRTRIKWGVQIPSAPGHVVYVWFDALLNYISAIGYDPEKKNNDFDAAWPADVHIVGKEIFRFHTVIWPAMLIALQIPLPKMVFAHGWWTVEGQKMSKSLGNVVDPHKMSEEYGVDAFRYFLLREVPFGSDGDFSEKALLGRYNSELANNFGNLLQRTITLTTKHFDGVIPPVKSQTELLSNLPDFIGKIEKLYDQLSFHEILESIYSLMIQTNKYIDEQAPWTLGSDEKEKLGNILVSCLQVLKVLTIVLHPFMPEKTQEAWTNLGEKEELGKAMTSLINDLKKGTVPEFKADQKVIKGTPLFMRKGGRWK